MSSKIEKPKDREENSMEFFVRMYCELFPVNTSKKVPVDEVYSSYIKVCEKYNIPEYSQRDFTRYLKSLGVKAGMRPTKGDYKNRAYHYIGIRM